MRARTEVTNECLELRTKITSPKTTYAFFVMKTNISVPNVSMSVPIAVGRDSRQFYVRN